MGGEYTELGRLVGARVRNARRGGIAKLCLHPVV